MLRIQLAVLLHHNNDQHYQAQEVEQYQGRGLEYFIQPCYDDTPEPPGL